jgi:hypothetical protein
LVGFLVVSSYAALALAHVWVAQVIHDAGSLRSGEAFTSFDLAVDSHGQVHLVYVSTFWGLVHMTNAGGWWSTSVVDSGVTYGDPAAVAVDAAGIVHVAYGHYDWRTSNSTLVYARGEGGAWTNQTLDAGSAPAIAVDPQGRVHIAYTSYRMSDLRYATLDGGVWTSEEIVATPHIYRGYGGFVLSLAVDPAGHGHLAYDTGYGVAYATDSAGSWVSDPVAPYAELGGLTALALDASDTPHIVVLMSGAVEHATIRGGTWNVSSIQSVGPRSPHNAGLGVESSGAVDVLWSDLTNLHLNWARGDGAHWSVTALTSGTLSGWNLGVAVGPGDRVHVVFEDVNSDSSGFGTGPSRITYLSNGVDASNVPGLVIGNGLLVLGEVAFLLAAAALWWHRKFRIGLRRPWKPLGESESPSPSFSRKPGG